MPGLTEAGARGGVPAGRLQSTEAAAGKSKQVYMQSACSGGIGTFIEKAARKLNVTPEALADANTLTKGGVPVEEIIASLFDAVVCQNLRRSTSPTSGRRPTAATPMKFCGAPKSAPGCRG